MRVPTRTATSAATWSAIAALGLIAAQFGAIRFAPSDIVVRIVLPATIAGVPAALWSLRRRAGVWIMFVGLAANLAAILANGGLMPIERQTVVQAVSETRAGRYAPGAWIAGSKDVLVAPGGGRLVWLGDQIVVGTVHGGFVASPGDIVVWAGMLVLAGEVSWTWQRRRAHVPHAHDAAREATPAAPSDGAEGGAFTSQ
jgi:hypothetical protein